MNSSLPLIEWLLERLTFDASLFHVGRYCGGWHATTQGLARASFHLVMHGGCWLHIEGEAEPARLERGDAAFILRDLDYRLSSAATAEQARALPRQVMQPMNEQAVEDTGLVCGFFHFHSGLSGLIVEALPRWIILRAGDPASTAAHRLFELILEECKRAPEPSAALLERLSHLLFIYVLRQQVSDNGDLGGLINLTRQPAFANLLEQLIARPQEAWSLEEMAARVGLSRSAFFKRFNELAGQSPGQVLLALRMHQACALLKSGQTVEQSASAVGYQSVAAFTRSFAKTTGVQPGAYRKLHEVRASS
jgi:AraC-like DNA-binding protein